MLQERIDINELLLRLLDNDISDEGLSTLRAWINSDPEAKRYYCQFMGDYSALALLAALPAEQDGLGILENSCFDDQVWSLLSEEERNAPAVEKAASEQKKSGPLLVQKVMPIRTVRTINKTAILTALISSAALFLMIVWVYLAPPKPYAVATVWDSIDAQWSSGLPVQSGTRVSSHSGPIRLTHGIVKLVTDDQVEVLLEAPSEFEFVSGSEVTLNYGKLFARVSERGYGFSVTTSNSKVVDLGTELGMLSQSDGNTQVHLYKGMANLFAGEKHQNKTSQLLSEGTARIVDYRNSDVQEIPLEEHLLVRNIDSSARLVWRGQNTIRLGDILLGGNGFGTAVQRTIEFGPDSRDVIACGPGLYQRGPGKLVPAPNQSCIDSIFVPGSESGPVIVSSGGHCFTECPKTSGLYYSNIICMKDWTFFHPLQKTFEQTRKRDADSEVLYLHSNIGLTVDLNVIRNLVPGLRINSFTSFAGIIRIGENSPEYSELDVWVLVDGRLRSSRKALRANQGFDIQVDIAERNRFLTLIVTDCGIVYDKNWPANHMDTCGFAEPIFGLVGP
ncbi:MAG: hypothetical protein JXB18_03535 [Sedimentisphaerales bacterium]|nr:hypothetical protein [Sedimentisphaerales bacterium]